MYAAARARREVRGRPTTADELERAWLSLRGTSRCRLSADASLSAGAASDSFDSSGGVWATGASFAVSRPARAMCRKLASDLVEEVGEARPISDDRPGCQDSRLSFAGLVVLMRTRRRGDRPRLVRPLSNCLV